MKRQIFSFLLISLVVVFVYRNWFTLHPLASGDWGYNYLTSFTPYTFVPQIWNENGNHGLGGSDIHILGVASFYLVTASFLMKYFQLEWIFIERLVWFWPFLLVSSLASLLFVKHILKNNVYFIAPFVFLCNTYTLMMVGGGQMGVAMGFALTPLVLFFAWKLREAVHSQTNKEKTCYALFFGSIFAVQVLFDIRIAYISMVIVCLYVMYCFILKKGSMYKKESISTLLFVFIIPLVLTCFIHAYWFLPILLLKLNPVKQVGIDYTSVGIIQFLSFTKVENALALLHPNWPENIFGKVYFFKPLFLVYPLVAYAALFFVQREPKEKQKNILFFLLLGVIGTFLAKGTNPPFGDVYLWLFEYIPGFVVFRDSTKWYLLIIVSYSILVPYTLYSILLYVEKKKSLLFLKYGGIFATLLLVGYLYWPVITGTISGTFHARGIPGEYKKFATFIETQDDYFRVLWIPKYQKFGYNSKGHPAMDASGLFKESQTSALIKKINSPEGRQLLVESRVKYIVVPYDNEGEIFVDDRKYSESLYRSTLLSVQKSPWLKEQKGFGNLHVFINNEFLSSGTSANKEDSRIDTVIAQKYVYYGLIISCVTVAFLVFISLRSKLI